jgi:hypothetical protein
MLDAVGFASSDAGFPTSSERRRRPHSVLARAVQPISLLVTCSMPSISGLGDQGGVIRLVNEAAGSGVESGGLDRCG